MLNVEMLPAQHGDSLLIEYGLEASPHYVLIDGGTPETVDIVQKRLLSIGNPVNLDLLVVTHIDEDHIGGILKLIYEAPAQITPDDVWFNAYRHLFQADELGGVQGEALSTAIEREKYPWNKAFNGKSVVVPDEQELPCKTLAGGARITLLSPYWKQLEALTSKWEVEVRKAGLIPGGGAEESDILGKRPPPVGLDVDELAAAKTPCDSSTSNGSSIAFVFEYDGKRVLFAADAHAGALLKSLNRMSNSRVAIDAWKVSHHGSRGNTSAALLQKVSCSRFLISTNSGTFGHPDPEAIAKIVKRPGSKEIFFNYETDYTLPWSDFDLFETYNYTATLGDSKKPGLVVNL